jgi:chromosome segregation ATPase
VQIRDTEIKLQGQSNVEGPAGMSNTHQLLSSKSIGPLCLVSSLRDKAVALEQETTDKDAQLKVLASDLELQNGRHRSESRHLQARIEALETKLEEQRNAADARSNAADTENSKLRSQRDILNEHRQDIEAALDALQADLANLFKENRKLSTERDELSSQRDETQQKQERLMQERDQALRLANSSVDRRTYEDIIQQWNIEKSQAKELSDTLEMLILETARLVKRNSNLEEDIENQKHLQSAAVQEKESLMRKLDDALDARDTVSEQHENLLGERDSALDKIQTVGVRNLACLSVTDIDLPLGF